MDPPHITEFASERYFSKLSQLKDRGDAASANAASASASQSAQIQTSKFIQPLQALLTDGAVHPPEPKQSKFSRFQAKVFSFNAKPQAPVQQPVQPAQPPSTDFTTHARVPLDQLFRALPNELQIQIINSLPLADVLNLRLVSSSWHTLITLNEAPIVRHHLDRNIPAYALRLYPAPDPSNVNFHYLCGLWHRLHVAAKLSHLMCDWITREIFLRTTKPQRQEFAPQQERMRRRLIPLLFTIFHFFEMYRKLHLQHLNENHGRGLGHTPYTRNPIEVRIMNMYDDKTLLRVHQVFPLVMSSFCRQLRPPTYVGRVESTLRGYLREKPPDEIHVAILCLGGLRQVERFWEIKGYNSRRGAVDQWYSSVALTPETNSKPKRSIKSLGRKRSVAVLSREFERHSLSDTNPAVDAPFGNPGGLVFNTSLAAGMPMSALPPDHAQKILHDLPLLQQIWTTTAEALILERKIVSRPQDILRNAQLMLDLIREDGLEEEDEWWYGRNAPESIRPPTEAMDCDTMHGVSGGFI